MQNRAIRFLRGGAVIQMDQVPPSCTLLDWLREEAGATGTKEGCGEGDCGACAVVLGELEGERIRYRVVNSCIRLLSSIDGCALWTVEDLRRPDGALHPVQQAMVDCHGSQCGFCTPGFVMSLFGLYQQRVACTGPQAVTREAAQEALSGNLCRCTGYRPILDAAQRMADYPLQRIDEAALLRQLRELQAQGGADRGLAAVSGAGIALRPATLGELLEARRQHPDAQVVAGATDVGLWVTKLHQRFSKTLDVTGVAELRSISATGGVLEIGAAARLGDAFNALAAQRPAIHAFAARFGGLPVRESGTLGGNIANGSPIGDSMPLLIALGARIRLQSAERGARELALEDFYLGYRQTALAPDELLTHILVPAPTDDELLKVYKVSKRFDDDISAVCLALRLRLRDGLVQQAGIGVGGLAATPARARRSEAALVGRRWDEAGVRQAAEVLRHEFAPISDMRASSDYRRTVAGNLLLRAWMEQQGRPVRLEGLTSLVRAA